MFFVVQLFVRQMKENSVSCHYFSLQRLNKRKRDKLNIWHTIQMYIYNSSKPPFWGNDNLTWSRMYMLNWEDVGALGYRCYLNLPSRATWKSTKALLFSQTIIACVPGKSGSSVWIKKWLWLGRRQACVFTSNTHTVLRNQSFNLSGCKVSQESVWVGWKSW